jgi:hypothetical protein
MADENKEVEPVANPTQGSVDYAKDQYNGITFAKDVPEKDLYPNRTDASGKEFYGKKRQVYPVKPTNSDDTNIPL